MIKLLPFILVPILILAGLGYWRYTSSKQDLETPVLEVQDQVPQEVPKTLPSPTPNPVATTQPVPKNSQPSSASSPAPDPRVDDLLAQVTELKARVSAVEKGSVASSKATSYIPLGGSTGPIKYTEWTSLGEYEISLDPASYQDYSGMSLEVNFRMVDPNDVGYVRLYNVTDSSSVSSELSTSSTTFGTKATGAFKLATGQKTYRLQVKSTGAKDVYIQSARIKVSF